MPAIGTMKRMLEYDQRKILKPDFGVLAVADVGGLPERGLEKSKAWDHGEQRRAEGTCVVPLFGRDGSCIAERRGRGEASELSSSAYQVGQ